MAHWELGIGNWELGIGNWELGIGNNVGMNLHLGLFSRTGKMPVPQEFTFLWGGILARPAIIQEK